MPRRREDDGAGATPTLREPRYSQSLERGLAILGCFTPKRPMLGIAELADELGMSRSTTHRYAITLVALGYLEQGASRKYRLGLRVADIGMAALNATGLRGPAHTYLDDLRLRTSHTASVGVLVGSDVIYLDHVCNARTREGIANGSYPLCVGARVPVYCSAMGKVLVAYLPERERDCYLADAKLIKRAPNTITSKRVLCGAFEEVRAAGLAVSDEELVAGLLMIAAPVRDESRAVIAAVEVVVQGRQSAKDIAAVLAPQVLAAADGLSGRLGYRRDDTGEYEG